MAIIKSCMVENNQQIHKMGRVVFLNSKVPLSFDCYHSYKMHARKVKTRTHMNLELSIMW